MRVEEERKVVLVERKQVAKLLSDYMEDGWEVQSSQPYTPPQEEGEEKPEEQVRIVLFKQHDINAPVIGNGGR